jgi:hypothetical protein
MNRKAQARNSKTQRRKSTEMQELVEILQLLPVDRMPDELTPDELKPDQFLSMLTAWVALEPLGSRLMSSISSVRLSLMREVELPMSSDCSMSAYGGGGISERPAEGTIN